MSDVSVRELRQNLSVYLRRVEEGETLAVTNRGRKVAVLAPLPGQGSVIDRLVAERGATRPTLRLEDLPPPITLPAGSKSISEHLEDQREERL